MNTLTSFLQEAAKDPQKVGFIFVNRKEEETFYHFSKVNERSQKAATTLYKLGIRKGDFVAIMLPTSIEFMDCFLGAQAIGAVPVPLYPPMRLGKLDEYFLRTGAMLQKVQAKILITEARIRRILGELRNHYRPPLGFVLAQDLQNEAIDSAVLSTPHEDDICMVQFSSGTTQHPKGVTLTHKQTLANVDAIAHSFPTDHNKTGCSWLPLYHDMGLIGCVFPAIALPGLLVLIPPEVFLTKPAIWLRSISRHQAFISPAPNFSYSLCTQRIKEKDIKEIDLRCWTMALNGAEPVAPEHLRQFIQRFAPYGFSATALTPVYGLAEASLAVTFSDPMQPFVSNTFHREELAQGKAIPSQDAYAIEIASVGKPLKGFSVEIRDQKGTTQPQGHVGDIWIKGPSLTKGYVGEQISPQIDGWLSTGDIGFFFQDELYISGRNKDILIIHGKNHSPYDIEHAVDEVPGVRIGCAVAVSNITSTGEQLFVFIEYKEKHSELATICAKTILEKTSLKPDVVILLEPGTIPRTSSGKLRRQATLTRYLQGTLIPPKKVNPFLIAGTFAKSALGYLKSRR